MATTDLLPNTQLALVCYCVILAIPVLFYSHHVGVVEDGSRGDPVPDVDDSIQGGFHSQSSETVSTQLTAIASNQEPDLSVSLCFNMSQSDHHNYADEMMIDDCRMKCIISIC